ncbi:MAG: hypothetical protein Q9213_001803 [Squamulea squamosa]
MADAPMIGTLYCRPNEPWAQCFIRFAYGQQSRTGAPMDCASFTSTSCSPPTRMMITPSSTEYWYGVFAIYGETVLSRIQVNSPLTAKTAIFTYIRTLASALLTTTGAPGALQSAYTSANAGSGASAAPNPVDATLFQLLFQNGFSDQDTAFAAHMKRQPYVAAFNSTNGMSDPPPDEVLYEGLIKNLQTRLTTIMGNWTEFQSVLGTGDIWMSPVQGPAQFVKQWTATAPSTASEVATS